MCIRTGVRYAGTKFSTIDTCYRYVYSCGTKFSVLNLVLNLVHRYRSTSHILKNIYSRCRSTMVCMHDVLNLVSDIVVLSVVLEY